MSPTRTILDDIVADTRELVARRRREVPRARLEERPMFAERATVSFVKAIASRGMSFIAEIKKASPSKGVIREDFDAARIAQQYAAAEADALSILTEPLHFKGELAFIPWVRAHGVALPVLRKDFIVDPYQLAEARAYGADAVLLIATVLSAGALYDLHAEATDLGLDCLVEVYSMDDLAKVDFDQVKLLGVNNRDLRTFEVDIANSLRIFAEVPRHVGRVAESGLSRPDELVHLRRHGVNGVLIGETFMRADDPGEALRTLREEARALAVQGS
jgi:indole-3-glycerol phosphate synthase